MKMRLSITAALTLAVLFGTVFYPHPTSASESAGAARTVWEDCVVIGSNNKPLRVRATPNGRVIGSLKLGSHIWAYDLVTDNYGDYWTRIKYKRGFGYVSTQYISCG